MGIAETLQTAATAVMTKLAEKFLEVLPNMLMAIILILLGWVIAILIKRFLLRLLKTMKFEEYLKSQKLDKALGNVVISDVLAMILYYYVLIVFFQAAFDLVYLTTISAFIGRILMYVPVLIGAVLLVVLAALTGEYIKILILQLEEKSGAVQVIARVVKFLVIYVGIVMGLSTMGFNTEILNATFISLSQAVFFGIALAFGISFGLGGQDAAKDWIKTARTKLIKA